MFSCCSASLLILIFTVELRYFTNGHLRSEQRKVRNVGIRSADFVAMRVELLEGQTKIFTQVEGGRERMVGGKLFYSQSISLTFLFAQQVHLKITANSWLFKITCIFLYIYVLILKDKVQQDISPWGGEVVARSIIGSQSSTFSSVNDQTSQENHIKSSATALLPGIYFASPVSVPAKCIILLFHLVLRREKKNFESASFTQDINTNLVMSWSVENCDLCCF